jgi:hypothetical protein
MILICPPAAEVWKASEEMKLETASSETYCALWETSALLSIIVTVDHLDQFHIVHTAGIASERQYDIVEKSPNTCHHGMNRMLSTTD